MGIALFTIDGLLGPMRALAAWLTQPQRHVAARPAIQPPGAGYRPEVRKTLRVVRVVETCCGPASAGRMIISGRMADVCAELERLAALEPITR